MRAGIICAAAVAAAAVCTAVLFRADVIGGAASPTRSAVVASNTPTPVRQVITTPIPGPLPDAQPAFQPAPVAPPQTAATSPPAPVETTGSLGASRTLYVNGTRVALRSAPDGKAKVIERLSEGQKLVELSRDGEWVRVRYASSNAEGWVANALVANALVGAARRK